MYCLCQMPDSHLLISHFFILKSCIAGFGIILVNSKGDKSAGTQFPENDIYFSYAVVVR